MLSLILPSVGNYCVAIQRSTGFSHHWFDAIADAEAFALRMDEQSHTVYIAQGSFKEPTRRTQANVHRLRSFWLDIDCGEGKPYANQPEGAKALRQFCSSVGMAEPSVVASGWGLYAYWHLDEDITPEQWGATAKLLKAATEYYRFEVDPARTCDCASVLRPIGSTNRKRADNHKGVFRCRETAPVGYAAMHKILASLPSAAKVQTKSAATPLGEIDFGLADPVPTSAHMIADKCNQLAHIRETKGNVEEPLWYAAIAVLHRTVEAPDIIHEWSEGHPSYSPSATNAKIRHYVESATGPTTCRRFAMLNETGCLGCKHAGRLSSPIRLGRMVKDIVPEPVGLETDSHTCTDASPPSPFRRTEEGVVIDRDGEPVVFYPYDLYVSGLAFDESLGYEVITIRHNLPLEGWMEFTIRTSLVNDPKALMTALWDNHVKVSGQFERKAMCAYMESFAQKLQRGRRITQLLCQMGWKETRQGKAFVLGKKIYHTDGSEEDAALARNIPQAAEAFHAAGELAPWSEATKVLAQPGMEAFAFSMAAAAFGAPLMKFTGYSGALVSMIGPSGAGKTLIGMWALSAYGRPDKLMMLKDDTKNALVSRLGVYGNLPLYIDEVTNISPEDLSDFVYRITQGRDKVRLTRSATERSVLNQWNTLALVSSNSSLMEKLGGYKGDAGAEMNRIFQYDVRQAPQFDRASATAIYRMFTENYGHAGRVYIRHLIQDLDAHQANIDRIVAKLDQRTNAHGEERFWSATAGVTLYGALLANRLGLTHFDISRLFEWCVDTINSMRGCKLDLVSDSVGALAQFLDEHIDNRLILTESKGRPGEQVQTYQDPRGSLLVRYELDTGKLYISRNAIRAWMTKRHLSYNDVRKDLEKSMALTDSGKRKVLGSCTPYAGAQQPCWELNMKHPKLGQVALAVVDGLAIGEKGASHG
jgi:Domain of unknown function (DUF927)